MEHKCTCGNKKYFIPLLEGCSIGSFALLPKLLCPYCLRIWEMEWDYIEKKHIFIEKEKINVLSNWR